MPELVRLDCLLIRWKANYFHRRRIFNRYSGALRLIEFHKKRFCFHSFFKPFRYDFAVYSHSDSPSFCHVSTRRVGDNQIPLHFQQLQRVCLDVPLRETTAARLNVAAVRIMPQRPERFADFLRLLTGHQHPHSLAASWSPSRARVLSSIVRLLLDCFPAFFAATRSASRITNALG